jgi:hypothetical protein
VSGGGVPSSNSGARKRANAAPVIDEVSPPSGEETNVMSYLASHMDSIDNIKQYLESYESDSDEEVNRIFVDYCTGEESVLGEKTSSSRGSLLIRITEKLDALKDNTQIR